MSGLSSPRKGGVQDDLLLPNDDGIDPVFTSSPGHADALLTENEEDLQLHAELTEQYELFASKGTWQETEAFGPTSVKQASCQEHGCMGWAQSVFGLRAKDEGSASDLLAGLDWEVVDEGGDALLASPERRHAHRQRLASPSATTLPPPNGAGDEWASIGFSDRVPL